MKFARAILILLCGFTLLLPPVMSAGSGGATGESNGRACSCVKCSCCVESPVSDAPATPAVPASSASSRELQVLLIDSVSLFLAPSALAPHLAMPASSSLRSVAIPLYQRDCAYVI